jgi:glucose-1-phosphate thymidylyltransferase
MPSDPSNLIGLIPAAGFGTRIAPLPVSKELFPIGFASNGLSVPRPRVAAQYLLDRMATAGVQRAFFILRPGKWDIPAYFGDGSSAGIPLAYLTVHIPHGVPFTLNQALPFVGDSTIVLGFPDILFWPANAYKALLDHLHRSASDVVLGLFPTNEPGSVGLVEIDRCGRVLGIYEKSAMSDLRLMWAIAVWRPTFTHFLHHFVERELRALTGANTTTAPEPQSPRAEYPIGDVIHAAARAGLVVEAEVFEDGRYIDIGTPENLLKAVRQELLASDTGSSSD